MENIVISRNTSLNEIKNMAAQAMGYADFAEVEKSTYAESYLSELIYEPSFDKFRNRIGCCYPIKKLTKRIEKEAASKVSQKELITAFTKSLKTTEGKAEYNAFLKKLDDLTEKHKTVIADCQNQLTALINANSPYTMKMRLNNYLGQFTIMNDENNRLYDYNVEVTYSFFSKNSKVKEWQVKPGSWIGVTVENTDPIILSQIWLMSALLTNKELISKFKTIVDESIKKIDQITEEKQLIKKENSKFYLEYNPYSGF